MSISYSVDPAIFSLKCLSVCGSAFKAYTENFTCYVAAHVPQESFVIFNCARKASRGGFLRKRFKTLRNHNTYLFQDGQLDSLGLFVAFLKQFV